MPRTFALSVPYRASVEQVYAAFTSEQYWLARLADSGADTATLDALTVGDDGEVAVAITQVISRCRLPALAAQFHPGDLTMVRREKWRPVRGGSVHAEITGRIVAAPAKLFGTAVLQPAGAGSTLRFTVTVRVDIPLVGGKVESFIGSQLGELTTAEQRFTSAWVAQPDQRRAY